MLTRQIFASARVLIIGLMVAALLGTASEAATAKKGVGPYWLIKMNVTDLPRSLAFFGDILGMKEAKRVHASKTATEVILNFDGNDNDFGVVLVNNTERKGPIDLGNGFTTVTFVVPDVRVVAKRITDAGYQLTQPVTDIKLPDLNATYAFAKGPDGYAIEIVHFND
jgi:catechol 2,3-dioxygenase-like lactoylglutathione lyase family enzyme